MTLEQTEEQLRSALDHMTSELTLAYPHYPRFDLDADRTLDPVPDLDRLLRRGRPATGPLVTGRRRRGRRRPGKHGQGRRRLSTRGAVAVVVAACVAAAGGVVLITTSSTTKASAATVLAEAEQNVGAGVSTVPAPGQYLYEQSASMTRMFESSNGHSWYVDLPFTDQLWIGADGSGRMRFVPGTPVFPSGADRAAWVAAGSPSLDQGSGYDQTYATMPAVVAGGPGQSHSQQMQTAGENAARIAAGQAAGQAVFPYPDVASLPTDPAALQQLLVDRYEGGRAQAQTTFSLAASLLEEGASPAQRVAIFKMISSLPGVTLVGTVTTDVSQQTGTALSLSENGDPSTIVIDPSTGDVLEQSFATVGTGQDPAGGLAPVDPTDPTATRAAELSGYTVYQASLVVGSTTSTGAGH